MKKGYQCGVVRCAHQPARETAPATRNGADSERYRQATRAMTSPADGRNPPSESRSTTGCKPARRARRAYRRIRPWIVMAACHHAASGGSGACGRGARISARSTYRVTIARLTAVSRLSS